MDKDLNIGIFLDYYRELLTSKQAEVVDLYYNHDLSLSEIAENLNITRQGVRDAVVRGSGALANFEKTLGLCRKDAIMERIKAVTANMKPDENTTELKRLILMFESGDEANGI